VRNRKKAVAFRCAIGACVCKTTKEVLHLRSLQRSNSAFFPNGLLLLDFCITFYQEKVMKENAFTQA
jgi:hypothetical protein